MEQSGNDPSSEALGRYQEVAALLTGQSEAMIEDGIEWVRRLVRALQIAGLARYGMTAADIPALVERAKVHAIVSGIALNLLAFAATRLGLRGLYDSASNSPGIEGFRFGPVGAEGGALLGRVLADPVTLLAIAITITARRALVGYGQLFVFVAFFEEVRHIKERVAFQAEVDEGRLHAGQDPGNFAFVDASGE